MFDVEKGEEAQPTFHVSGRFAHPLALLQQVFGTHGFVFNQVRETAMRSERGAAVTRLFCALA